MATHSRILAGQSHGQKSMVVCSPWGHKESDTAEWLNNKNNLCTGPDSKYQRLGLQYINFGVGAPFSPYYLDTLLCKVRNNLL